MNRFAALCLELNLELSRTSQAQSQQAETEFGIKFATKLIPIHGLMNIRLTLLRTWLVLACSLPGPDSQAAAIGDTPTVLAIEGTRFTLQGKPTFLLGFSYYGALSASPEFVERDLAWFQEHGFNWLRVWATWAAGSTNVSAVDVAGGPRQPFLDRLAWLVAACDRRGMVVDVTLTRGRGAGPEEGRLPDFTSHRRAVETLVTRLKAHRNWYLDLANERDVRDARFVGAKELKALRDRVRELDPGRMVTASFGGHDLDEGEVREALVEIGLDFLTPHRPREAGSPAQTAAQTRRVLELARVLGRLAPVHHQEPFRRGYGDWQPRAEDFRTDLRGAVEGGAAGWCFHNGSQRTSPDQEPWRSFDLRRRALVDQLDAEERKFLAGEGLKALLTR